MKNVTTPQTNTKEDMAKCVSTISTVFDDCTDKWFISFGALLYFIRDKNMGVPFEQDFDVSVLGQDQAGRIEGMFKEFGFTVARKVINNVNRKPFQIVFKHPTIKYVIDVFFWVNANGHWWHTYDPSLSGNPVLKKYIFKGTPEKAFGPDRLGNEFQTYSWEAIAPPVRFPPLYGTLLDLWYPNWFIPDSQFGQSKGKVVSLNSCSNLGGNLK